MNERISDDAIREAIQRAERGLIDADLGGGVIKQRIPRPNEGRSGGYRSIIIYQAGKRSFFLHGFAKNDRDNITRNELAVFVDLGEWLLSISDAEIDQALQARELREVSGNGQSL